MRWDCKCIFAEVANNRESFLFFGLGEWMRNFRSCLRDCQKPFLESCVVLLPNPNLTFHPNPIEPVSYWGHEDAKTHCSHHCDCRGAERLRVAGNSAA
jgi:hypothetical protein